MFSFFGSSQFKRLNLATSFRFLLLTAFVFSFCLHSPAAQAETAGKADKGWKEKCNLVIGKFGALMEAEAKAGRIPATIGRREQVAQVVSNTLKRNVKSTIITGGRESGKSSVFYEAYRELKGSHQIYIIDPAMIQAGAAHAGGLEAAVSEMVKAAEGHPVVLYFRDFSELVEVGKAQGQIPLIKMLQNAMDRGFITVWSELTNEEWDRLPENIQKLFNRTRLPASPKEESLEVLKSHAESLLAHYGSQNLKISDLAYETILKYAESVQHPGSAIRLLETLLASMNLGKKDIIRLKEVTEARSRLNAAESEKRDVTSLLASANKRLSALHSPRRGLLGRGSSASDSTVDVNLVTAEIAELSERLAAIEVQISDHQEFVAVEEKSELTVAYIDAYMAKQDERVNAGANLSLFASRIVGLEAHLNSKIAGQQEAIRVLVEALSAAALGVNNPNKPLLTTLSVGPSGVGKSLTMKKLSERLFKATEAYLGIDMSEFQEKHSVSRLTGAPPGYIGYEEGGTLTEAARRRANLLVNFDELEKAHPAVWRLLLQLLDEGRLTDGRGRKADFSGAIVNGTTNLGLDWIMRQKAKGRDLSSESFKRDLRSFIVGDREDLDMTERERDYYSHRYPPIPREIINRFDAILFFDFLEGEDLQMIFDIERKKIENLFSRQHGIQIDYGPGVYEALLQVEVDQNKGGRQLEANLRKYLTNPASTVLLNATATDSGEADFDIVKGARVETEIVHDESDPEIRRLVIRAVSASGSVLGTREVEITALDYKLKLERRALEPAPADTSPQFQAAPGFTLDENGMPFPEQTSGSPDQIYYVDPGNPEGFVGLVDPADYPDLQGGDLWSRPFEGGDFQIGEIVGPDGPIDGIFDEVSGEPVDSGDAFPGGFMPDTPGGEVSGDPDSRPGRGAEGTEGRGDDSRPRRPGDRDGPDEETETQPGR